MTDSPAAPHTRKRAPLVIVALCAAVLLAVHVVGGYFVLFAYMRSSQGAWDTNVKEMVRLGATVGVVAEVFAFALTVAFVSLAGLRRWWYAVPGVLILLAVVRMIFAPSP